MDLLAQVRSVLGQRYAVDREVGRGGMAVVFLAHDIKHGRRVAVKVLRPEVAGAIGADRFVREIEIAARLTHPHILPLHDSGHVGDILYYVMPYVEGESLRHLLEREKQLALDDALRIVFEIADAVGHAHSLGIVHRDLKPENVLLEAGHAVLSDFGIARAITAAGGASLTRTGIALGTMASAVSPYSGSVCRRAASASDRAPAALAATGDRERALRVLERARPRGAHLFSDMQSSDLNSLRRDPRFQRLATESRPATR